MGSGSILTDAFVGRRVEIQRHLVCAMQGYFPVLIRTGDDALAAVFRTGAPHYGLTGTLATARSDDGGRTWSDPIEVAPRGDDVRNPAFGVDADGAWVLAYWKASVHFYPASPGGERRFARPAPGAITDAPDLFVVRSHDRGATWSAPAPYHSDALSFCSPYGRIVTAPDGSLMMPAYGTPRADATGAFAAVVLRSRDGGRTWGDETRVAEHTSELALAWLAPDDLLGVVRHADGHCVLVRSRDGGRTWTAPAPFTRALEHPADLCVLADGRVVCTYGRRRRPLGCAALVSHDRGATWDHGSELLLAGDGIGNDVGYPSTVQLADRTLVTALYFARGSAASDAWGEVSCQALRYPPDLFPPVVLR